MRKVLFVGLALGCLNGCVSTMWGGEQQRLSAGSARPVEEVEALFAQANIDPLTRYLQRYHSDPSRAPYLEDVQAERERRCAKVATRYSQQALTASALAKLKRGYQFSCPAQVEAFAQQLASSVYNECYLVTKLHNFSESQRLCREAAESDDPRAQLNMAISSKALQDYPTALYWAQRATAHFPAANHLLGQLYAQGLGVEQDQVEAVRLYSLAARQGFPAAQTALGKMYLQGVGVERDPLSARAWLLKAAQQNEAEALLYLGEISEKGLLDAPDLPQAMVWYDLASQKGLREVRDRMLTLSHQLDVDKFILAQSLVETLLRTQPE